MGDSGYSRNKGSDEAGVNAIFDHGQSESNRSEIPQLLYSLQEKNTDLNKRVGRLEDRVQRRDATIYSLEATISALESDLEYERVKTRSHSASQVDVSGYNQGIDEDEGKVGAALKQLKTTLDDVFQHRKMEVKQLAKYTQGQATYNQETDHTSQALDDLREHKRKAKEQDIVIERMKAQLHNAEQEIDQSRTTVKQLVSEVEKVVGQNAALKHDNKDLSLRLSDEMSTKLSRDESSLENVSIKNRPMNITAEYQQLCSEQWLEAKTAVDEATKRTRFTEQEKHEFLLDIFMQAEEKAVDVLNQNNNNIYELILNPPGKSYRSSYKSEKKPFDVSQVPEKVQTSISDFRRTAVDSTDLSELISQVEKSLNTSYRTVGDEIKYKNEAKQAVCSLICAVVSLVWKMVNQRPAMRFETLGVREPYDANIQEICWGSPDLHGRSMYVDVYSHPVLLHGDKVMAKGKVLIKETRY